MADDLGKVAYEGYFKSCNGKSLISGTPLPTWENQSSAIQEAWHAAAEAVVSSIMGSSK